MFFCGIHLGNEVAKIGHKYDIQNKHTPQKHVVAGSAFFIRRTRPKKAAIAEKNHDTLWSTKSRPYPV